MKVSVIIPTYNRTECLRRALKSVAAQTYKNYEVIVVQNGITTDSEAIVKEFQSQGLPIRYLFDSKPDPVNARNVGIKHSTGNLIAFLDDDDEWLPEKLSRQVEVMQQQPGLGLVACGGWYFEGNKNTLQRIDTHHGEITYETLMSDGCVVPSLSAVMIRRECLDRVGLFDLRYPIANDYELYFRILKHYSIQITDEILFHYYRHEQNMSKAYVNLWVEQAHILNRLKGEKKSGITPKMIRDAVATYCRRIYALGVDAMDQGRYRAAFDYHRQVLGFCPTMGLYVQWGKFTNPFYRFLRPYLATAYCGILSLVKAGK